MTQGKDRIPQRIREAAERKGFFDLSREERIRLRERFLENLKGTLNSQDLVRAHKVRRRGDEHDRH